VDLLRQRLPAEASHGDVQPPGPLRVGDEDVDAQHLPSRPSDVRKPSRYVQLDPTCFQLAGADDAE